MADELARVDATEEVGEKWDSEMEWERSIGARSRADEVVEAGGVDQGTIDTKYVSTSSSNRGKTRQSRKEAYVVQHGR